ncbi:hypothetical protein NPIL_511751 [Nephila pilipes]|uniref:Uncharacterized protein n=1 Tax=Nephila pilipes TaxID=299642 RepID=A0A8X6UMY9_NEPPI|nr:hypothetical protein NPIL_511751 [Nephila pilipes]
MSGEKQRRRTALTRSRSRDEPVWTIQPSSGAIERRVATKSDFRRRQKRAKLQERFSHAISLVNRDQCKKPLLIIRKTFIVSLCDKYNKLEKPVPPITDGRRECNLSHTANVTVIRPVL